MIKRKRVIRPFNILPKNENMQYNIRIFTVLKNEKGISVPDISEKADVPEKTVAKYINACVKSGLVKISGEHDNGFVEFDNDKTVIGIGFKGGKCVLNQVDLKGEISKKNEIETGNIKWPNVKNKEVKEIIEKIKQLKNDYNGISMAGITLPAGISDKHAELLTGGISSVFDADLCITRETTSSGYAQKDTGPSSRGKDILYMHSDIGEGVVFKGEEIFEADASGKDAVRYLRPWGQFSVVETAKNLVNKGVGTDIVHMAGGELKNITLDIVLNAAENGDELAGDLVKRAGLALGVRVAYLVNMFKPEIVILGGGIKEGKSAFVKLTRESAQKFFSKEQKVLPEIVSERQIEDVFSIGAALLCRREIFMEV